MFFLSLSSGSNIRLLKMAADGSTSPELVTHEEAKRIIRRLGTYVFSTRHEFVQSRLYERKNNLRFSANLFGCVLIFNTRKIFYS